MKNLFVSDDPFILHALSFLRNKTTDIQTFRNYADQISYLLVSRAFQGVQLVDKQIETPVNKAKVFMLPEDFVVIPILRSGVAMLPAALKLLPHAKVGIAGLKRNKEAVAEEYYWNMPKTSSDTRILIIDPMLATGGSILHVLHNLDSKRLKEIRIVSIISAPEGIHAIHKEYPFVPIFTSAVDQGLDKNKLIVPGIGDFGDRYFGTT